MSELRILAVDDSATMRRIIVNSLKSAGYNDVTEATDGADALSKMRTNRYDFVITDWNMPEMSGETFVTTLRQKQETKDIPILVVTARSVQADIDHALEAGVNGYIVKPFTPDTIRDKIAAVLSTA